MNKRVKDKEKGQRGSLGRVKPCNPSLFFTGRIIQLPRMGRGSSASVGPNPRYPAGPTSTDPDGPHYLSGIRLGRDWLHSAGLFPSTGSAPTSIARRPVYGAADRDRCSAPTPELYSETLCNRSCYTIEGYWVYQSQAKTHWQAC